MDTLLVPGVKLINQLRYPHKFLLILIIMLLPMVIMGYMIVSSIEDKNHALDDEHIGLSYFSGIRPLIQHIPQHRGMSGAFLNGAESFRQKMLQKQTKIDQMFSQLSDIDDELGKKLETDSKVRDLRNQWEELKGNVFSWTPEQSFKGHTKLIGEIIELGHHVADTSGLILDPMLDSYYMMDLIVNQMPILTEGMGQSRALGSGVAARGKMDPDSWAQLAIRMDRIRAAEKSMNLHNEVIFRENAALRASLEHKSQAAADAVAAFAELITTRMLDPDEITITTDEIFASSTKAINGVFDYYDAIVPELEGLFLERINEGIHTEITLLATMILVILFIIYLFASFYRAVMDSINHIIEGSQKLSEGDLTTSIALNTRDEMNKIADSFNAMSSSFHEVVSKVLDSSAQVATAAEELSSVTHETTQGIATQQSETDQVATAINEMAATVQEVSTNAQNASIASEQADIETITGAGVVSNSIEQINALAEGINNAANVINALEANSEEIGTVVDVIRNIAEQTNLLALNAAIEAARAGEQGRGFAVVADEVRNLASKTQASTEEIQAIVENLQQSAGQAAQQMNNSSEQASQGVTAVTEAGTSLEKIKTAVSTIKDMNIQIASAAEEQSVVANEINHNIVNIKGVSEQNTVGAEQTTVSSAELANLASSLQQMMSRFKV